MKLYRVIKENGEGALSSLPGLLAGNRRHKIFGRLDCKSGKRMKKKNRVFFSSRSAALAAGYRACKNCKP